MEKLDLPNLGNYIHRYRINAMLLRKHPDKAHLLTKKIEDAQNSIIKIVTSDAFAERYLGTDYPILRERVVD